MSKYLQWWVLYRLTGSPVGSMFAVLVFWWVADRFTLRILPDPIVWWRRRRHAARLRERLASNPHDRRARFELADILVTRKKYADAITVLKPNLEAGDDDVPTLFLMGAACLGNQHFQQGEVFLEEARKVEPRFRTGEIDLELAKGRLAREDGKGALEALERFIAVQPGTIVGKVLQAKAFSLAGDAAAAKRANDEAWRNYVASPAYQKRRDRWWAWRARPSRPLVYGAIALVVVVAVSRFVVSPIVENLRTEAQVEDDYYDAE